MDTVLSKRIVELLKEKNMSQKELSEKADITESALSHYIKGDRTPRSDTLSSIAIVLNTSTDYLLGNDAFEYPQIKRILARNSNALTKDEKVQLISVLFGGESN